jgi:hypothetical protein
MTKQTMTPLRQRMIDDMTIRNMSIAFSFSDVGRSATLDSATFAVAAAEPDWLDRAMRPLSSRRISLEPLAIVFFEPST